MNTIDSLRKYVLGQMAESYIGGSMTITIHEEASWSSKLDRIQVIKANPKNARDYITVRIQGDLVHVQTTGIVEKGKAGTSIKTSLHNTELIDLIDQAMAAFIAEVKNAKES